MKKYKSGQNESIFDVALATGGMDGLAALLKDNPALIDNAGQITQGRVTHTVTGNESAGGTLTTTVADPVFSTATPATVTAGSSDETVRTNGRRSIKSGQNQTLFDVAIRYGGLGQILTHNPDLIQNDGSFSQYRVEHRVQTPVSRSQEIERINQGQSEVERVKGDPVYLSGVRQTFFDVCLTQYGGVESLPFLLADNPTTVEENGMLRQFRKTHKIRKNAFVNLSLKQKMLSIRPESGTPPAGGAWVTEDGQDWWTNDNQAWETV